MVSAAIAQRPMRPQPSAPALRQIQPSAHGACPFSNVFACEWTNQTNRAISRPADRYAGCNNRTQAYRPPQDRTRYRIRKTMRLIAIAVATAHEDFAFAGMVGCADH